MSSTPPVELDFLGIRSAADHRSATTSSSIRGMKTSAIASIGPQQLRRVIGAAEPPTPAPASKTMTLFYNGTVATFDAEVILRMAAEVVSANDARGPGDTLVANFAKDMPLTRTRSLQQFLHKRKERLARAGPYQLGAAKSVRVKEETA
ncbi:hypothetical protein EJB05_38297 [Eragrostis curvula]|uniref:Protein TIFY n=1 Tax=Eragrostis curvula TaxID=38414 RepID=A0A5J9TTX0_9POAL|nr:hypothetical protein EJB05_38297 [Eragrostis curvula]